MKYKPRLMVVNSILNNSDCGISNLELILISRKGSSKFPFVTESNHVDDGECREQLILSDVKAMNRSRIINYTKTHQTCFINEEESESPHIYRRLVAGGNFSIGTVINEIDAYKIGYALPLLDTIALNIKDILETKDVDVCKEILVDTDAYNKACGSIIDCRKDSLNMFFDELASLGFCPGIIKITDTDANEELVYFVDYDSGNVGADCLELYQDTKLEITLSRSPKTSCYEAIDFENFTVGIELRCPVHDLSNAYIRK